MSPAPSKTSELERFLNDFVRCTLVVIFASSLYCAIGHTLLGAAELNFFKVFVTYLIFLYITLPMTLYIMFEMLRLILAWQIQRDALMWDSDSDTFAAVRNSTVMEELGQVDFLFSDKTGTLTANEMRFAFCCIGEKTLGPFLMESVTGIPGPGTADARSMLEGENSVQREVARSFFELLALCHTAKVSQDGVYEGESPDEVALLYAAQNVGVSLNVQSFLGAGKISSVLGTSWGVLRREVSHVISFSSDRKRMSVVCPDDGGGAIVLVKGADNIMEDLLESPLPDKARAAVAGFASKGLRTLVLATRRMDADFYDTWKAQWDRANAVIEDRDTQVAAVAAIAESHLTYVGITAVEDRLQDGVPATIGALRSVGIRLWVLTGDKVETAVEIAKSCNLFEDNMSITRIVGAASSEEIIANIDATQPSGDGSKLPVRGIVIDGMSVQHLINNSAAEGAFYELAERSSACIACRLSPSQKAELVQLVRKMNPKAITLSIGDGANDVPMIQAAHVGVGIRGKEGLGSVQASDVAISQFRFLGNLVLCHGRKAYRRIANFLCFFIYKGVVLGCSYVIYAHTDGFAAHPCFATFLDDVYNFVSSSAVVVLLAFDFDIPDTVALQSGALYGRGQERAYLNAHRFLKWMASAVLHGSLAWFVPMAMLPSGDDHFWNASFTAYTIIVIVIHLKLFVIAEKPMRPIGVAAIVLELVFYVVVGTALSSSPKISPELAAGGVPGVVFTSWQNIRLFVFVPGIAVLPDVVDAWLWPIRGK